MSAINSIKILKLDNENKIINNNSGTYNINQINTLASNNNTETIETNINANTSNFCSLLGIDENNIVNIKEGGNKATIVLLEDGTKYSYRTDNNGNITELYGFESPNDHIPNEYIIFTYNDSGFLETRNRYELDQSGKYELIESINLVQDQLIGKIGDLSTEDISSWYTDYSNEAPLRDSITNILDEQVIDSINNNISSAVQEAGVGTGKAVAAAAVALITSLKEAGYYIPYYWGGGHGNIPYGINESWGTKDSDGKGYSTKRHYNGLDCSGLVAWAFTQAGIDLSSFSSLDATGIGNNGTKINSLADAKPGDVIYNDTHIRLIVDVITDDTGTYAICAEANVDQHNGMIDEPGAGTGAGVYLSIVTPQTISAGNNQIATFNNLYSDRP